MKTLTRKKLLKAVVIRTTDGLKATVKMNAVFVLPFIAQLGTVIPDTHIKDINIVDRLKATEPPKDGGKKRPWGTHWCPYCAEYRRFIVLDHGYMGCEICEVSDADFYVKIYNRLKGDGIPKTYESPEAAARAAKRAARRLKRQKRKKE